MKPNQKNQKNDINEVNSRQINYNKLLISAACVFLLSFFIMPIVLDSAMAWGPSTPSGNKWVTNKSCTFTATSSGLYGYSSVQYQIENNGWNPSVYSSGSTSIVVNLQNESPTGNSRWRVQFYKWDGVDSYGNPYGYGWTGWSGWAYFGVDSVKPTVPNRISPANDAYVKCSASSPLVLDWSDSSDAMSGFKQYKLDVNGSGLYYPTASQQSFTSMSEGWHNWYVYSRDNCFGVAFDSSTSWESDASAGVWRFYVDNTPPTPGVKRKPNYDASAGATVPWGTIVAVNPYAPVAEAGYAGNNDNPRVNGIVTGAGIPELVFTCTPATDAGGINRYNLNVADTTPPISPAVNRNMVIGSPVYYYLKVSDFGWGSWQNGTYDWNVTAYDNAGNFAVYGAPFKVIIDQTSPNNFAKTAPLPNTPAALNYYATNIADITFKWANASDNDQIRKYELFIAPEPGSYAASGVDCALLTSASRTIASEGKYKWSVRAYDRALNYRWSKPDFYFVYDVTKPVPGVKEEPWCTISGGSVTDMFCTKSKNVNFKWTGATDSLAGVKSYELYIDNNFVNSYTAAPVTPVLITNIAEGLHTWNVKVFDYAGNWEWYGPDWQFKVDLTPPVAGGKDEPLNYPLSAPPKISVYKASTSGAKSATVTFKWKSSTDSGAGASGIDKADLILKDGNQTSIIGTYHGLQTAGGDFTITSTGSGSYSRTINEGIYTWNMEIFDRATNSSLYDSGLFWKFVVDGTPPTAGIKTAPQHANIDSPDYTYDSLTHISKSNIVNFYWSAASDPFPSGGAVTYNITLYKEATTTKVTGYPKIGVISPFTNPTPLQDGDYTWNVTAVDQAGHETDYDGPGSANISKWNLKVDTTPPASGTLQGIKDGLGTHMGASQASGIDINTGTPTFIWKAAKDPKPSFGDESGIDKYKIVIEIPRGTIKFDSGYIQKSSADLNNGTFSPNLSFTLPDDKKLADDGPYYWTIYVKDVAGNETKYDQQWNFYVDTKLGFETLNYELLVSRENAKLPGSPALYEPSPNYEVLVSGAPPIVYTNEYTPVTDIVPSAPDPASNRYGTTFYWSVRNQDETGLWGKYEDYAVNIVTLYSGELVKPTDKSYCPTKPKFEWTHAKPEEVRRGYRIVVYKGTAWPAGAPALATDKYIDQTFISETGLDLPLEYQAVNALPDGKYFWSVYSIDDMTKETRFNQVWSFEIIRKPFVTMASQNIKWYAGYPNCVFVDAFGANGYETLATCEVTLYRDAAGTIPIRKFTQTKEGLLPAAIKILDSSDSLERMEASKMANQTMSYTITDSKYPSDKRYLFNISPYYNYLDKYTDGKIYARAKVYFYDINNTSETNIYTEYPDSSKSELPVLVGEVENKVKLRPYVPNSSSDTASVFFAQGVKKISNGEPVYAFLRPDITKPPDTVQYVDSETSSENLLSIYYNGMAYFESPHSASSSSLDAASSGALKAGDGSKLVWRITRFQNNLYDATMRTKLFKNADYIPQNTYDFMKVLAAFTGKQPISVSLATINSVPGGDTAGVALKWAISLDDGDTRPGDMPQSYLDIGEGSNNETLTKYETWVYASSSNSSLKFTYAADMIGHLFLNGEALADDYNLYNYGKNYVTVPLGKFAKQGWNHLAVYVLHQQHPDGNTDLNGICYKLILPNDSTVKAFNDSAVVTLWNSFPTPQPYLSGLYQKGRGTAIVVYDLLTDGTLAVAKSMDGPAIEPAHCGVFFADPLALSMTKIYARKPFEGGDHKTSIGIISYEDFNSTKVRFRTDDAYGDEGFIKFHVEQKPYIPNNVNRINIANPTLVCSGDYVDVESIATLKPQLSVLESPNKDPDNFGNSKGFHHSLYYDDYRLPKNPDTKREDEVRYVYAISDNPDDIEKRYPDMNWSYVKYKAPANLITLWNNFDFASYLGPTHIVNSGFTAADEARNVNGVISPIFYYKVWAIDEHGFLQEEGSPLKRFCIDLSPPVVRDIQVYYDKEGIRLDEDKSMFVENDQSPEGTLSVALVGHTLTLWAFCTDEITADPRKFKDAKFYVRKHGSTDPWFEIDATCEVDTDILYQDIKFAFQKTPPKHPNNYLWFAFYTIPYNADLTSYDVDFQVADALGNRSAKLSESADEDLAKLTKKQFSVATLGFKNVTVPPKSNSSVLNVAWQSFEDWRKCDSVSHYIVSIGDLTPNPFETSNWVDGSLRSCTREVRIEGKVPVFVMPVEKITTVGFGSDYSDAIYSFEEPKSVVNFKDGWRESEESGGYFSADVKKIKSGMYSWSNFMNSTPGKYSIYKDFNIESGIKVTFGAWVKKETGTWSTSKTKLQVICYNDSNTIINPSGADNDVTFENEYDNVSSDAWVHYYLNVNDQKFFETPPGTSRIRLQLTCDSGSKVYIDQLGFASYAETEVDFTPPQKPVVSIGVFNHHNNTYDSATIFGYWDGAWDIKGSAWFDEPANFPTLLSSNLVDLFPTTDNKKVGQYSYKVSNSTENASVGFFQNADIKLDVEAGDLLRIWANFESKGSGETKRNIDGFAIAFSDGTSWSTKVYYGSSPDKLNNAFVAKGLGGAADGMNKLGEMGDSNTWLPLDINISDIGMEGRQISGLAFAISATYENAIVPVTVHDTLAVYLDFIDIHSGAGVKNYLPQLEISRSDSNVSFWDFSTLKTPEGLYQSGFMRVPSFDDVQFTSMPQATDELAFTDKLSLLVSSDINGMDYVRTGLSAAETASVPPVTLSQKVKLDWSSMTDSAEAEYNGGAVVLWTNVKKVDYARDSLSELNIGVEYLAAGKLYLTVAKYRAAALSPKSKRPPEFSVLQKTEDLSSEEVFLSAEMINRVAPPSLYKMTDRFENELTGELPFKRNFIDAGRMPPSNGEWVPLVIPVMRLVPAGINVSKINIKSLTIEAANCSVYIDHIGKTTTFKQLGDWQGNVSDKVFVQDHSTSLTDEQIHNPEKSVDGSESVKLTTASAGERSFYLRLQPKRDPDGEDPGFNPALYHLIVPEEGGIISVNVYLGKDKERLPEELMLEFHRVGDPEGSVNMKHRVFWGKQNIFIDGVTSTNDQRYYYMGAIPESDSEGGWCELLVPTQLLNMNNFKFDGVNIRAHSYKTSGFDVWFDRMGMLGVVPHVGENVRHSVYAWNLDDYVFYSMRVKSWDFVLNESGYAYSKYVRSKDRTPPIIEAGMPPRINYQGINDQAIKYIEPMGGVYYVHKNADDSTAEVPLVFKKPDGSYDKNKEVDLSLTTEDYLSFETIDSSRATSNKVSIGYKKLRGGESVEILLTQPTARDPLPSAEYINSEWITDISGLGMTPEEDINLNDTKNIWLVDPLKRYAGIKYYFMNNSNYIARQIVYDDEGNFALGGDTYIDVTPGPLARLSFYYPQVPVIDIKADGMGSPAEIIEGKDYIKDSSEAWIGVSAYDAMGNPVLKGHKLNFRWSGYYKGINGNTHDMNSTPFETKRRMTIKPSGGSAIFDDNKPFRKEYEPPPRPYFQIKYDGYSVELAQKLLTPDQYDVLGILKYCTQEVEIYSYTGYNIHGDAYEVGFNGNAVKNNLGGTLKSGDAEAHFVTTTRAGDVFSVTVSNEDESVVAQSPRFRVVPGGIAEVVVEPQEVEIEAEHGQATFNVKGFDKYKNYKLKYCDAETFDAAYRSEDESATYEYVSTNEIVVNPLWLLESHEVEYQAAGDKYNVKNSEEVGVFSSEGRTSTNTFGAGWEHGTREVWVIDTTEAAFAHAGSKALNSNAELRYKIKSIPWNIYDKEIFALATASIIVKPLLKGYLSFRNHDDEETQALYMNAVSGKYAEDPFGVDAVDPHNGKPGKYAQDPVSSKFIIDDVLKFYVQTYSDRGQLTSADSNAEVIVQLDTAEDDLARVYRWPVVDKNAGYTELKVKLDKGSAEIGLVAYNSRKKPKVKLYYIKNPSVNLNDTPTTQAYKDITIPDKRALATVHVYPNELDHIFFEPDISNPNKRYEVVKRRSLPVKAYGYDFRGNMITPIEYSESPGWTASAGELKDEMKSATHLMSIFTATESLNPLAGTPIPVDLTVKAQANFKKLSAPKDANIRKTGVIIKKEEKGYLAVVNFGLFDFPCIYQELDKDKLDKNGEYELSFLYTSGNNSSDSRPAHAYVGIAYMRNADAGSVPDSEIHMLYSGPLNSGGKISGRPFKLRFKIDSLAAANDGKTNGVNNLDDAKKILVFLGAPKSDAERPALRYDHVTIERVK